MNRRQLLSALGGFGALALLPRLGLAVTRSRQAVIGAAWRGPAPTDPYFAGALVADWPEAGAAPGEKAGAAAGGKLAIRYAVPLPTRPHGLLAEADGGLLVVGARPGVWLLRCDGAGKVVRQHRIEEEGNARLNGHALVAADGERLFTTETDRVTGRGKIGVRDRHTLRKVAEWDTHGIDPHQVLLDRDGHLIVANGGVPRTGEDKKFDLHRMDASLVRLDAQTGRLLKQWRLDDPRLSLRHLAWSLPPNHPPTRPPNGMLNARDALLGIALQAEHDTAVQRAAAPILAVLEGERLHVPTRANDGFGYAGDITAAGQGGFTLSSNQVGVAQLWQPAQPDVLTPIVKMKEVYALTGWNGPGAGGGVLVATALGLGRWHPSAPPLLLPWPQAMALDNHWVLMAEA